MTTHMTKILSTGFYLLAFTSLVTSPPGACRGWNTLRKTFEVANMAKEAMPKHDYDLGAPLQ